MSKIKLPYNPHDWQKKFHQNKKRFNLLVVHRRAGKTFAQVADLFNSALRFEDIDGRFVFISPYLKQSKTNAWMYFKRFAAAIPGCEIRETDLTVILPHNKATISLWGADNPDGLRGTYIDGIVLDEFAQMKSEVWEEIVFPALNNFGRAPGWATICGTPKGVNAFSEMYYKRRTDPNWSVHLFTVKDTNVYTPKQIEEIRTQMGAAKFEQEMMCSFDISAEGSLISFADVIAARERPKIDKDQNRAAVILGADIGRSSDPSAICIRQGPTILEMNRYKIDNMTLASIIAQKINQFNITGIFIDDTGGWGNGPIDRLRSLGFNPVGVNFSSRADDDKRFKNKRAEIWFDVKAWIETVGCIPNDHDLTQDLCAPIWKVDGNGRNMLESKDVLRDRIKRSTDFGDALALTFSYPVSAPEYHDIGSIALPPMPPREDGFWFA